MKLKFLIASILLCLVASAQINDPNVLRNYINATIIPNNTRNVTAQQLNNIMNGQLNVMQLADIDSFTTSKTFDTLYIYQHTSTNTVIRKGYHIGGNFDTTSLNNRINSLNTTKVNTSDSLTKYVTPSQLKQVSGGNVYIPGDDIVKISGSAITVDTITRLLTQPAAVATYTPKTRKINNKSLTNDVTLNKGDFTDLNLVDNTSDMDKPLSNKQQDSLTKKVDKTTKVNGKALSANVTISQSDIPALPDSILKKVDKRTGYDLSSNDYTSSEKIIVSTVLDTVQAFDSVLDFTRGRRERLLTQTGILHLSLKANVNHLAGKVIKQWIDVSDDSIVIPNGWTDLTHIQKHHTNILRYEYGQDATITVTNDVIDKNYSNYTVLDSGQSSFLTYEKQAFNRLFITPDQKVTVKVGTVPNGNDLIKSVVLYPNVTWTLDLGSSSKFSIPRRIWISGTTPNTIIEVFPTQEP